MEKHHNKVKFLYKYKTFFIFKIESIKISWFHQKKCSIYFYPTMKDAISGFYHRWKKLRKTGRCFPENIWSGRKFWENMYMFSSLTENYSNTVTNLQKKTTSLDSPWILLNCLQLTQRYTHFCAFLLLSII